VAIAISLVPPPAVVGVTAVAGDWNDSLGALLLFTTNVLAIIVLGAILFSVVGLLPAAPGAPAMRRRPVYSVVAVAGIVVVLALAGATANAVRLQNRTAAAHDVAAGWAKDNDEEPVSVRFHGNTRLGVVEGDEDSGDDAALLTLLGDAVPSGTPVELNRVAGARRALGEVH
jgi:hypothetical protein